MPPLEARLWERAPLTPLTDVLTGMGTAWKEKLWELGGSGGMLPQNFFPQKIKVYAIWGYPEVIFMETWQLMSCSFTLKKPQRVWDWAHANAHSNQRTQRCALVQMLLCVEVVLQGCNTMAGIIFMTHLCCKQCTMLHTTTTSTFRNRMLMRSFFTSKSFTSNSTDIHSHFNLLAQSLSLNFSPWLTPQVTDMVNL